MKYDITVDVTTVSDKVGDTVRIPLCLKVQLVWICACLEQEIVLEPEPGTGSDRYCYQDASRSSGFAVRAAQCLAFRNNFKQCSGSGRPGLYWRDQGIINQSGDKPFPVRPEIARGADGFSAGFASAFKPG